MLYYFISKHFIETDKIRTARIFLKKTLELIESYNQPANLVFIPKIGIMEVGALYWMIDDVKALSEIYDLINAHKYGENSKIFKFEIKKWILDIYLNNDKIDLAIKTFESLKDPTFRAIGLIYIADYYLTREFLEKGQNYLEKAHSAIKDGFSIEYQRLFDEIYRIFIFRKQNPGKLNRKRYVEIGWAR